MCEACIAVCCGNLGTNGRTSCDHRMLRYVSRYIVKRRVENSILRIAMELEVEGRTKKASRYAKEDLE